MDRRWKSVSSKAGPHLDRGTDTGSWKHTRPNASSGLGADQSQPIGSTDPERLELAMQGRAFHADEFGRARDVAREAADLGNQIVALEHFPRLTQRQPHDVFAIIAGRHRRHHRADIL